MSKTKKSKLRRLWKCKVHTYRARENYDGYRQQVIDLALEMQLRSETSINFPYN